MVISFGYKHGAPSNVAAIHDIRDLSHDTTGDAFKQRTAQIVEDGKKQPGQSIAIGCEDGKHRSVVMASRVASALRTGLYHRDKGK